MSRDIARRAMAHSPWLRSVRQMHHYIEQDRLFASARESDALFSIMSVLQPEASRICILLALCTNVANALEKGRLVQERMLIRFFPHTSSSLMIASLRLRRFWPERATVEALSAFTTALAQAYQNLPAFFATSRAHTADETAALAATFRLCCSAGLKLLDIVDGEFLRHPLTKGAEADVRLHALLLAAIEGGCEAVHDDGSITMPDWAERRKHRRIFVSYSAELIGKETQSVSVRNLSVAGAGLDTNADLVVGEPVILNIPGELRVSGTVTWSRPGKAAVTFDEPLTQSDPRLSFCEAFAGRHRDMW